VSEFRRQFRDTLASGADKPWGGAAVVLRQTDQFIGLCWLTPSKFLGDRIELGFRYVPGAWGKGLATEAGRSILRIGLEELHLREIGAAVHPDNLASIRVLEKLGFERLDDRPHPQAGCNVRVYQLPAP
jgi:RimJ/RimL family protein N-acetyltransferase